MSCSLRPILLGLVLIFLAGCGGSDGGDAFLDDAPGGGDPTGGSPAAAQHLAGGGREASQDQMAGGAEGSGPASPAFPEDQPISGLVVLFYSDTDCQTAPGARILRSQAEWQTWWEDASDCASGGGAAGGGVDPGTGGGGGVEPGDPTEPGDPVEPVEPGIAPEIDFQNHIIAVISLEPASVPGRGLWVRDSDTSTGSTFIHYEVSSFTSGCFDPGSEYETTPTIAVLIPLPAPEPVAFERNDIVYDCDWIPDPGQPWAMYYTDSDCDLGPNEAVLDSESAWTAWLETALACDASRWGDPGTSPSGGGAGMEPGGVEPGDPIPEPEPVPPAPTTLGLEVDFTTHAVIILRAAPQERWGGGVWLDAIEPAAGGGTEIRYTAVVPSAECPLVEGRATVRPTVAIRAPLPLATPIAWSRTLEIIDCAWEEPVSSEGEGVTDPGR